MTFVLDAARVFVAAAASALLLAGQAAAQPAAPRAAVEVSRGFDDAEFDFVVEGSIDASTLTSSCRGFINPEPTKVVDVTEHGAPLVIGVRWRAFVELLDQASLEEPFEGGVERARRQRHFPAGALPDVLDDGVAVEVLIREGQQDLEDRHG